MLIFIYILPITMKHLKLFESFKDIYYKKITSLDYFRARNLSLSENELNKIISIVYQKGGWVQRHKIDLTIHIPRLKGTVTFDEHTTVKKGDDEYYYVAFDIMNRKEFYEADQFDGLIKLLEDIL